jgi:GNAT superfamily N-acetyltransferase
VGVRLIGDGEGDVAALRAVRLAALADAPDAFSGTLDQARRRPVDDWARWPAPGARFLYEPADGDAAGMIVVVGSAGDPTARELMAMWVAPRLRGSGAGDALVRAALDWARADGAARAVVRLYEANGAARRLYERNGFRADGVVVPADDRGRVEIELDQVL